MRTLSTEHAQRIVETVAPGHRLVSASPAAASFTNDASILDCRTSTGKKLRLVVKLLVDKPVDAPELAAASYYALRLVRAHGIPAPEPIYLDEAGALLGAPGIVTRFVEGRQESDRRDPIAWAETLARLLVRIHDISPSEKDRQRLFDGNHMALYILRGDEPERRAGNHLADVIYDTVRELRSNVSPVATSLVHMDYWQGNVLWRDGRVTAVLDWDHASYGDPVLDVSYFRMNMYLRGIKEAAEPFLQCYEAESGGTVKNLGFWELTMAARPLPDPALWIPASREMGDAAATDERAGTDFVEFVRDAKRRACAGR